MIIFPFCHTRFIFLHINFMLLNGCYIRLFRIYEYQVSETIPSYRNKLDSLLFFIDVLQKGTRLPPDTNQIKTPRRECRAQHRYRCEIRLPDSGRKVARQATDTVLSQKKNGKKSKQWETP